MSTVSTTGGLGTNERALRDDMEALKADLATLKTDLRAFASDAQYAAKTGAKIARECVGEAAPYAADRGREAVDAAKAKGKEAADAAENTIVEHPFAAVGVAFGVGLLLGALVSRR